MSKLTAIIPFLNENEEVYNTVKSLRETANSDLEIMLINDSSTDGYDYYKIAKEFRTTYIEHDKRKGVAASRDEGVEKCSTDFFILLDAHMRVFQDDWHELLLDALNQDQRAVYCAKTIALNKDGSIREDKKLKGYGAYINLKDLSIHWLAMDFDSKNSIVDIPCVLGASYACSKTYWQRIKGLRGLSSYGFDEQMLSLKVWLEGGRCRLLKNISFGHIFRLVEEVPYESIPIDFVYNKMLVTELLIDSSYKMDIIRDSKNKMDFEEFNSVIETIISKKDELLIEQDYYKRIFTTPFAKIVKMNNELMAQQKLLLDVESLNNFI